MQDMRWLWSSASFTDILIYVVTALNFIVLCYDLWIRLVFKYMLLICAVWIIIWLVLIYLICQNWQEDQKNETYFHIAVSCIAQSLKTQVINRSYDEVVICFFNTVRRYDKVKDPLAISLFLSEVSYFFVIFSWCSFILDYHSIILDWLFTFSGERGFCM